MKRRERTRHLIELGGLVVKAKLDDRMQDDRAALYGAFQTLAMMLDAPEGVGTLEIWRRRGRHAFEAEEEARKGSGEQASATDPNGRRRHRQ